MRFPITLLFTPAEAAFLSEQLSAPDVILESLAETNTSFLESPPYPFALARAEVARLWSQIERTRAAWLRNAVDVDVLIAAFSNSAGQGRVAVGIRRKLKAVARFQVAA